MEFYSNSIQMGLKRDLKQRLGSPHSIKSNNRLRY